MGGSGSGGWTPTPIGSPCSTLTFRSSINSPQPASLKGLKADSVLDVALQTTPNQAAVVEHKGKVVGALTGPKIANLINCLQNGYTFKADVIAINGGDCQVKVRPE